MKNQTKRLVIKKRIQYKFKIISLFEHYVYTVTSIYLKSLIIYLNQKYLKLILLTKTLEILILLSQLPVNLATTLATKTPMFVILSFAKSV